MASIHKRERSPFWYAAFTMPDGSRAFRSTKKRERRAAMEICLEWERAAKLGREGRLSENQARQVVADIFTRANAAAMPSGTVKEFLDGWLSRKGLEVAESSLVEYEQVARLFLAYLAAKAARPIDAITTKEIGGYRAHLAQRVSGATVNKHLKILRGAWKQALR